MDKNISIEEKYDIYVFSRMSTFLELIDPLIQEANAEKQSEISRILHQDASFVNLFEVLKIKVSRS